MSVVKLIDDNGNVVNVVDKDGFLKAKQYGRNAAPNFQRFDFSDIDSGDVNQQVVIKEVKPDTDKMWRLTNIGVDIRTDNNANGDFSFIIRQGNSSTVATDYHQNLITTIKNTLSNNTICVQMASGTVKNGETVYGAESGQVLQNAIKDLYITNDFPLYLIIRSDLDQSITDRKSVSIAYIEEEC